MRFRIDHEIAAPIASLEAALLSADLCARLVQRLPSIQSIEPLTHRLEAGGLERVWRFQARAPLGALARFQAAHEWLSWEERLHYDAADQQARWWIVPRGDDSPGAPWRRYFTAQGRYQLVPLAPDRTCRTVTGELKVRLRVLGPLVERAALRELRRAYGAEAQVVDAWCQGSPDVGP